MDKIAISYSGENNKLLQGSNISKEETNKIESNKTTKKPSLTPYQMYLVQKNGGRNKTQYFDFYNDVKHPTHQIYDW